MRNTSWIGGLLLSLAIVGPADGADLRDVRLWEGPDATRVVFDLSESAGHKVFTLENPARIVVDIDQSGSKDNVSRVQKILGKGIVQKVRSAPRDNGSLRVVLDLSQNVQPKSFALDPTDDYGFRIVLDLAKPVAAPAQELSATVKQVVEAAKPLQQDKEKAAVREKSIIVAVDAGHGGEDPGARGSTGLLEKDVTLDIARKLVKLINAEPGMKAVLTRDGDYYVGLRERVNKARAAQADLFVSVHANAFKDKHMHGTAVYTLSNRGATSEQARWLAHKENAADMVGGIELNSKDDDLAKVLLDISQDATMEASFDLGSRILRSMGKVNKLQKRTVQQAGFAVLKAPDIPSVLVETAFITNPQEEKMLGDPDEQSTMARAILDGIKGYFRTYRPREERVVEKPDPAGLRKVSDIPADAPPPQPSRSLQVSYHPALEMDAGGQPTVPSRH